MSFTKSQIFIVRSFAAFFIAAALFSTLLSLSCSREAAKSNREMMQELIQVAGGPGADWKEAKKLSYKMVKAYPDDPLARIMHALALEQSGQKANALDEIKRAVELDRDNFFAQLTLGRILHDNERYDDALEPLRNAERLDPDDQNATVLLAKCCQLSGNYPDAIKYYAKLAKSPLFSEKPEPYNQLGVILYKRGEYAKCKDLLVMGLKRDSSSPTVTLNLAILYDRAFNDPKRAVLLYQKFLELSLKNLSMEKKRAEVDERIKVLKQN